MFFGSEVVVTRINNGKDPNESHENPTGMGITALFPCMENEKEHGIIQRKWKCKKIAVHSSSDRSVSIDYFSEIEKLST